MRLRRVNSPKTDGLAASKARGIRPFRPCEGMMRTGRAKFRRPRLDLRKELLSSAMALNAKACLEGTPPYRHLLTSDKKPEKRREIAG